jgi:hypothetical protein
MMSRCNLTTSLYVQVMLSHKNVIAQCHQLKGMAGPDRKRYLACLPLFHSKRAHATYNHSCDNTDLTNSQWTCALPQLANC